MEEDLEKCVRAKKPWSNLPITLKKLLANSPKEYEKFILSFSIKNQLRFRGSLVRTVYKDEKRYYEAIVKDSVQRLLLFPYHLADMIVKGLRITPFIYYTEVVLYLIEQEKSYDTMPNFTAADCLRLLGIGRNEYLELVSKSRSVGRRTRSRVLRTLLPKVPCDVPIQPWWRVELGYVLEEDVKPLSESERSLLDLLIDRGSQTAGTLDYNDVRILYRRGLIYLDVPITGADRVSLPPLKGFVMNRVAGDHFETLLYQVFVSIDENTTVGELAGVIQVECEMVKQAVSLYCRLGFANNMNPPPVIPFHDSWNNTSLSNSRPCKSITPLTFDPSDSDTIEMEPVIMKYDLPSTSKQHCYTSQSSQDVSDSPSMGRRVAILFDSTLAAYLMMGNLSPDLKSHAVTLFEVGKLSDESLDSLLIELDKVASDPEIEGEARRYLTAALCLRKALRSLRETLRPLDLLRCEALQALDTAARERLLINKYKACISVAGLSRGIAMWPVSCAVPLLGACSAEMHSAWLRLFLGHVAGYGPPALLLIKGTRLRTIPRLLLGFNRLCVFPWGGDNSEAVWLPASLALKAANAALAQGPVLLQAAGVRDKPNLRYLLFPKEADFSTESLSLWSRHAGLRRLYNRLRLSRTVGYLTLADIGVPDFGCANPPSVVQLVPSKKRKEICGMAKPVSEISLSSNDSNSTEYKTKDKLRSPIESHFANTPVIDSQNHSPANGFTCAESGRLLSDEIDNLTIDNVDQTIDTRTVDTQTIDKELACVPDINELLSPGDDSVSMFSQLSDKLLEMATEGDSGVETNNVSDEDSCKPEKWTILDIQFGIPLFDEELCEKVCKCIVERIYKPELLNQIKSDNDSLSADVLKFVSQCQYYPDEGMGIVKRGHLAPLPRKNLAFENGRITEWTGK